MCVDIDLFGDVIVNQSDVNLWLDTIANLRGCSEPQREHYAQFYDVATKIKAYKLSGKFYFLIS